MTYEGDGKHARDVVAAMGLDKDSKGSDSPLPVEYEEQSEDELLPPGEAREYRRVAAMAACAALDRPDLQFATGVLGRTASRPTTRSDRNLKRVARFLLAHPRVVFRYPRVSLDDAMCVEGWSDADWAKCRVTRRSVSGGIITLGGAAVRTWSNRQASVSLSSAESEFYAATKAAAELLGFASLMKGFGWHVKVPMTLWVDAEAARGMANKAGLTRARHLEIRFLWLQEVVAKGLITTTWVPSASNAADGLTKLKGFDEAMRLVSRVGVVRPSMNLWR